MSLAPIGLARTRKGEIVTVNGPAIAAAIEAFELEAGKLTEAHLRALIAAVASASPHLHASCEATEMFTRSNR